MSQCDMFPVPIRTRRLDSEESPYNKTCWGAYGIVAGETKCPTSGHRQPVSRERNEG